jgi:eukaryotic-like serine/threonine-protein kinase
VHTTEQLNTTLAGRYDVVRLIGAGGMATVYLATDLRHNRKVALKVLNPELGAVLGVERFLAEIQVTANLQHPNLVPLFDSGEAGGLLFYVMPYVDGESLRARLDREKHLAVEEAIHISSAVAHALDYAHRHGVIHRDLKPENILLQDGEPLVADFGIALAVSKAGGNRITQSGLSLGTPQYMSPEQATGDRAIDGRTDIYSLGAVTYEMLTGEPPHVGSTAQAIIARVLTEKPRSIRATRATVPAHIEAAIETALEKLPADRWPTANGFAEALARAVRPTPAAASTRDTPWAAVVHAILRERLIAWPITLVAVGVLAVVMLKASPSVAPEQPAEFEITLPDSLAFSVSNAVNAFALSKDGSTLVFQATRVGEPQALYLRRLNDRAIRKVRVSDGAKRPSISPDGRQVLFESTTGALMRVSSQGGTAQTIVKSGGSSTWGNAGEIVFDSDRRILIVSAASGVARVLATPDSTRRHVRYRFPAMLPRGDAALIAIFKGADVVDSAVLGVVTIPDGRVTELGIRGLNPQYSQSGYLFYGTPEGGLFATSFSPQSLRASGEPIKVADGIQIGTGGAAAFTVADNGTIAYFGGLPIGARTMVAVSRTGTERPLLAKPGYYQTPRVSPDGRKIAVAVYTAAGPSNQSRPNPDIWISDLRTKVLTRVTIDSASFRAAWSGDGADLVYLRAPNGDTVARMRSLYDTGLVTTLARATRPITEISVARSSGAIALRVDGGRSSSDVYLAHRDSLGATRPVLSAPYDERSPSLSPDGQRLAYVSDKTGVAEVYVRSLSRNGSEIQVSADGGREPVWSSTGLELFYRTSDHMVAARLATGPRLEIERRDTLFRDPYMAFGSNGPANYDAFPDAKEFVLLRSGNGLSEYRKLIVLLNWKPKAGSAGPRRP